MVIILETREEDIKKVIDGRAPEYLTASFDTLPFEHYYAIRAKTSYHLPKQSSEENILLFYHKRPQCS